MNNKARNKDPIQVQCTIKLLTHTSGSVFGVWFCLVSDVTSFCAYASGHFDLAYWKLRHVAPDNIRTSFIFTGLLRQWRCSSQHKSRYMHLFLDKGQATENLKQSTDSVLVK